MEAVFLNIFDQLVDVRKMHKNDFILIMIVNTWVGDI